MTALLVLLIFNPTAPPLSLLTISQSCLFSTRKWWRQKGKELSLSLAYFQPFSPSSSIGSILLVLLIFNPTYGPNTTLYFSQSCLFSTRFVVFVAVLAMASFVFSQSCLFSTHHILYHRFVYLSLSLAYFQRERGFLPRLRRPGPGPLSLAYFQLSPALLRNCSPISLSLAYFQRTWCRPR